MPAVTISEFSSLNFRDDWKLPFQQNENYTQRFLRTDVLLIQYSTDPESGIKPFLKNNATGEIRELEAKLLDETTNTYNVLIGPVFTTEDTSFTIFFATDPAGDPFLSTSSVCVRMALMTLVVFHIPKVDFESKSQPSALKSSSCRVYFIY